MNAVVEQSNTSDEIQKLKARLKAMWSSGDYGDVAHHLEDSSHEFLKRHPVQSGTRVLDVACGTGQIAIPAAGAGAEAHGIDIAPNLIDQGRRRAREAGVDVRLEVGDAEDLPYEDDSFDQVYTLIGAMFAPRPERVAAELKRVCKPGGRIVMGNWTPEGFVGRFFKTTAKHNPPSPLMPSPLLWGVETNVRERLGDDVADYTFDKTFFELRYEFPPAEVVDYFGHYFGPVRSAFAALDDDGRRALHKDLTELWSRHNQAGPGATHVKAELLEVVATLRA